MQSAFVYVWGKILKSILANILIPCRSMNLAVFSSKKVCQYVSAEGPDRKIVETFRRLSTYYIIFAQKF